MDYYLKKYSISDCFVVTKNLTTEEISRIGINPFLVVHRCKRCSEKLYTGPDCRSCGSMYHLICAKISRTCCGCPILPATDFLIKFNCNKCDEAVHYGPQCAKCKRMFHNNCLEPFDKCCKISIFNFQRRDCRTCFKYVDIGPKCPSCGSLYHTNCIMNSFECCNIPFSDDENAYYYCSKCSTRVVTYGPMCFICGKMVHKRCMDFYPQCCGQMLGKDVYFIPHLQFDSQGRYCKGRKRTKINPVNVKCPEKTEEKPVSVCGNNFQENSSSTNDFSYLKEDLKSLFDLAAVTKEMLPIITTMKQENAEIHITADSLEDRPISYAPPVEMENFCTVKTESVAAPNNYSLCSLPNEIENYPDPDTIDGPFYEESSDSDTEADPPVLEVETIENGDNMKLNSEPPVLETPFNTENEDNMKLNSEPPILETPYNMEIKDQTDKGVLPVSKAIVKKSTVRKIPSRQQPKRISTSKENLSKSINVVSDILVVPGSLNINKSSQTLKVNPAQMALKEHTKRRYSKKENGNKSTKATLQNNRNRKNKIDQNSDLQQIKSGKRTSAAQEKTNVRRKSQRKSSSCNKIKKETLPPHALENLPVERDTIASPATSSSESEDLFAILSENSDDSLQNFFYYLYSTVKKFPRNVQIQTKSELFKTVIEAELKLK